MDASSKDVAPASRGSRISPAWILVLLFVVFGGTFLTIRSVTRKPSAGKMADYSWIVTDLDGKPVAMESFRDRPVFLNVWATWCPPCVTEMPSIARLSQNPKLKDVAFLCVSVDDTIESVQSFFATLRPPMTVLHARGPTPEIFETGAYPSTFLIAPGGRIIQSQVGSRDWDSPEIIASLTRLGQDSR